jgi:N-acyl-D-glutamate deacylase
VGAAQAYGEVLSFAPATGANVHICHLNSTSFRDMTLAVPMIHRALEQGLKVTVEAYPYGAASTGIGAKFLARENLSRIGMTYGSVEYQGRRLNGSSFKELRARNPAAIVVGHSSELPRDQKLAGLRPSPTHPPQINHGRGGRGGRCRRQHLQRRRDVAGGS